MIIFVSLSANMRYSRDVIGNYITNNTINLGEWNKTYGGNNDDWAYFVQPTTDNDYIVVGLTRSFGAGNEDIWLIKVDKEGNEIWNKTYGGSKGERGYCVQQINDGYIVVGYTMSFGAGGYDIWLIKVDKEGNEIWNKTYGGKRNEYGGTIKEVNEGYIILGQTYSFGAGKGDIWLIKVDKEGNEIWNKTYGGEGDDYCGGITKINDGFIIVGSLNASTFHNRGDLWLIKVDKEGNEIWNRRFGGSLFEYGVTVQQTNDAAYLIAGITASFGAGKMDAWLIKTREPPLQIEISGGLGITITVKNIGGEDLSNVEWSIDMSGMIILGNIKKGVIPSLANGEEVKIKVLLLGFGEGSIEVKIADMSKKAGFYMFGPFVYLL